MENNVENCRRYLEHLAVTRGRSSQTLRAYESDLRHFFAFGRERGWRLHELSHVQIRSYLSYVHQQHYARSSIARKLSCLRGFFAFLVEDGQMTQNPLAHVSSPKRRQNLPHFLYPRELEALLAAPDETSPLGLRDRAIMETLYASGVRVSELVALRLSDLDLSLGAARVMGKGRKERYVLLGRCAQEALRAYLDRGRPILTTDGRGAQLQEGEFLFLNRFGGRLSDRSVRRLIDKYVNQVSLTLKVSPHTFRHTFATHLLNGGADMRAVQELLGHVHLSTTQVYTHTTKEGLRGVYLRNHPRAISEEG